MKILIILLLGTGLFYLVDKLGQKKPTYEDFPPEYYGEDCNGKSHFLSKRTKREQRELEERQAKYTKRQRKRENANRIVQLGDD